MKKNMTVIVLGSALLLSMLLVMQFEVKSTASIYSELWIAPKPYRNDTVWDGSYDFDQLFTNESENQWIDARQAVKVFKFYQLWIWPETCLSDDQLAQMLAKLDSWGIKIAIEAGAVKEWGLADKTFDVVRACIERIQRLGGEVSYLATDEPLYSGTMSPPDGWGFTIEETAKETAKFTALVKANFPNIIIGDIEPYPCFNKSELVEWIDAYKNASGEDFSFFHMDVDYCRPEVAYLPYKCFQDLRELKDFVRTRYMEFGMIFIGLWRIGGDEQFYKDALDWAYDYYAFAGDTDHAIIQSWLNRPDYVLPDSSGFSFTQLVRDFSLKKTSSLSVSMNQELRIVQGRLTDDAGNSLTSRSVSLEYNAPMGTLQELRMEVKAPDASTGAIVGFRVNDEITPFADAPMEFNVYNISLSTLVSTNLVRNFDFGENLTNWGVWGNGTAKIVPKDEGGGKMLNVAANESEFIDMNSDVMSVNSGEIYLFSVQMKPFIITLGSGYFTLVWLDNNEEIGRDRIYIGSSAYLATVITNETGWFSSAWHSKADGRYDVTALYMGEENFWGTHAFCQFFNTVPPHIETMSPQNKTYTTNSIVLSFTVDEAISWIAYSLDGQLNVTIAGNTTLSGLSDGMHNLIVYAKDIAGNTGASELVYFSITTRQDQPFPIWIVATMAIIFTVVAVALVYLAKTKKNK